MAKNLNWVGTSGTRLRSVQINQNETEKQTKLKGGETVSEQMFEHIFD